MDPRNAAKVTAPDLLEAFHESAPRQDGDDTSSLHVYVVIAKGNEVVGTFQYSYADVEVALQRLRVHLQTGDEANGFIAVADETPQLFIDACDALSAIEA